MQNSNFRNYIEYGCWCHFTYTKIRTAQVRVFTNQLFYIISEKPFHTPHTVHMLCIQRLIAKSTRRENKKTYESCIYIYIVPYRSELLICYTQDSCRFWEKLYDSPLELPNIGIGRYFVLFCASFVRLLIFCRSFHRMKIMSRCSQRSFRHEQVKKNKTNNQY